MMKYIVFANLCVVAVDASKEGGAISGLLKEFKHHLSDTAAEYSIIGEIHFKESIQCPSTAVLYHDKKLYADANYVYCIDGGSIVRINLDENIFHLSVDQHTGSGLLILVMQTLLNWYLPKSGLIFMHTASFKYMDKIYAISGFGGAGKTEIMLEALNKGAQYISDDLAIYDAHGRIYPYLRRISLHDYPFTDLQLEEYKLDKSQYRLMKYCQTKSDRISRYLYQRYRGRFNISIDKAENSAFESRGGYAVDYNFWLDSSGRNALVDISKEDFVRKMIFCMENEFRSYSDFDGYFGCIYDFWNDMRQQRNKIIESALASLDVQGLSINGNDYKELLSIILK